MIDDPTTPAPPRGRGRPKGQTVRTNDTVLTIRLPKAVLDQLAAVAEERGLSVAAVVRERVIEGIDQSGAERSLDPVDRSVLLTEKSRAHKAVGQQDCPIGMLRSVIDLLDRCRIAAPDPPALSRAIEAARVIVARHDGDIYK